MSLVMRYVRRPGDLAQERLVMRAQADVDIGHYVICRTFSVDGQIYADVDLAFWFRDKQVRKGDWVVLYTKAGEDKEKKGNTGTVTHFFYWGQSTAIWNDDQRSAVLMDIKNWRVLDPRTERKG